MTISLYSLLPSLNKQTMAFDLTIGTEPAKALQVSYRTVHAELSEFLMFLQDSIQDELQKRGFSPDAGSCFAKLS